MILILAERPDGEPDAILWRALNEQHPVAQHAMPQERRSVVEDDEIDELGRDHRAQTRREAPDRPPTVGACRVVVQEHRDIEVARRARRPSRATAEEERQAHAFLDAKHAAETIADGIGIQGGHPSQRYCSSTTGATGSTPRMQKLRRRP